MKKRLLIMVVAVFALILAGPAARAEETATVVLDGVIQSYDVPAQIVNGRTMVPLRAIFEGLGATVDWNADRQTATARKGGTVVTLCVGACVADKNGEAVTLDVPAQEVNGRILVPLRFVSESLGAEVQFSNNVVTIISGPAAGMAYETLPMDEWGFTYEGYTKRHIPAGLGVVRYDSGTTLSGVFQLDVANRCMRIYGGQEVMPNGATICGQFEMGKDKCIVSYATLNYPGMWSGHDLYIVIELSNGSPMSVNMTGELVSANSGCRFEGTVSMESGGEHGSMKGTKYYPDGSSEYIDVTF